MADFKSMANVLLSTDWGLFFIGCISVDDYWNNVYDLLFGLIAVYVPISRTSCRSRTPKGISKRQKKKLIEAWKCWRSYPSLANKKKFNKCSKELSNYIKRKKLLKEFALAHKNSNEIFSYVNSQAVSKLVYIPAHR